MKLLGSLLVIITAAILLMLIVTADAPTHYKPGRHNAIHAIQKVWCGRSNRECWQGNQAISVAKCEAAQYWTWNIPHLARNGQYRGMLQMGSWERRTYGHGPDPWSQARAAFRYYVASGRDWSPWECKP